MSEDPGSTAEYYDVDDVEKAIQALSKAEHVRLRHISLNRAQVLDSYPDQIAPELLAEAVLRTLDGRRRWRKGVDFLYHLDQAMRSIANSWCKSHTETSLGDEPEVIVALAEKEFEAGQEWLLRSEPRQDHVLMRKERLKWIRAAFSDDAEASEVLEGWAMEMTGPEIQETSGMSKKTFEAAVRRIRYQVVRSELDRGV